MTEKDCFFLHSRATPCYQENTMIVKILCRSNGYKVGQIVNLPTSKALELINLGIAEEFNSEKFCYSNRMQKIRNFKKVAQS